MIMNNMPFDPQRSGETAGVNAPPQFGICLVDAPESPNPWLAAPASADATARPAAQGDVPPPAKSGSVVAKLAKLLASREKDSRLEHPAHWEDGFLQQKVLPLLQAKQPL
jgi:hypothetical protein